MSDDAARRIADLMQSRETMGADWGMVIEEACAGFARIAMTVNEAMLNGRGTAHGGAIVTLADIASAYACNSHDTTTVAQAATIHFLGPARPGDRLAEAQETMLAGRSGSYAISVLTEDGRAIASLHGLSRTVGGPILQPEE